MRIVTRMIEDELYEAAAEDDTKVTIDMREKKSKHHQSPVQLVLSALSACGAVDIVSILKKRKKTIENFIIESQGERRAEPPRSFTTIHCRYIVTSADVTEDELYKAAKLSLEKYCSVADSLKAAITFSVHVVKP